MLTTHPAMTGERTVSKTAVNSNRIDSENPTDLPDNILETDDTSNLKSGQASDPHGRDELPQEMKQHNKVGTNRGVETLFRNTYRVHVEVSALADSKANFLISVNSIIMVLMVSHGMNYIAHKVLFIPIGIVMATSIGSMVFAVLAARPRINKGGAHSTQVPDAGPNLLFFGSFTRLSKEDFIGKLTEIVRDPQALYRAMMADIYEMGLVLQQKFSRLKVAYNFLLIGLPIGVVIFLIMQGMIVGGSLK